MGYNAYSLEQEAAEQQRFITKVYTWMSIGLALTGATAYTIAGNEAIMSVLLGSFALRIGLIIGQLVLVGVLAGFTQKMSAQLATFIFLGYAVLNGVTFSVIFLVYTQESITSTFLITALTFGAMSLYGYTTKTDLTKLGSLLFMGVIGLVIASLINIFLKSSMLQWITSCAGVLIFVGLTAYDTQKIKNMNIIGNEGTEEDHKEAILGALSLYLDFINLFLYLLRLFGNKKE
ncbi:Bax inhibitor-1 family protein [Leptospira sp. 'Mane']|uniref:Bax inhibitor-1/YccA family protein n=1 Tax=Leptospira sp. 'Mane' TaxID=3387407 RepID=UPI00398B4F17